MSSEKLKLLLKDLGKPTMRGVRRCPECGMLNGTRGISCKNKNCDNVFKEKDKKNTGTSDAVRISTDQNSLLCSVRVRDRGPDYRGFVHLPLIHSLDSSLSTSINSSVILSASKCYVDSCMSNSRTKTMTCSCSHVSSALNCQQDADQLCIMNSVVEQIPMAEEKQHHIWSLLSLGGTAPVQRVTRNVMAVKCDVDNKHPVGFLHVSFSQKIRTKAQTEYKFQCACRTYKSAKNFGSVTENQRKMCLHFYLCVCAFASDTVLANEFKPYIDMARLPKPTLLVSPVTGTADELTTEMFVAAESVVDSNEPVLDLFMDEAIGRPTKKLKTTDSILDTLSLDKNVSEGETSQIIHVDLDVAASQILASQPIFRRLTTTNKSITSKHGPLRSSNETEVESSVSLSFLEWLSSVTERINQTMHYQFDGKPEPLSFHIPQRFFDCLLQRISSHSRKKRLPNSTTKIPNKRSMPAGVYQLYSWNITNVFHLRRIFSTPERPLECTKWFVENRDGTYEPFDMLDVRPDSSDSGKQAIQPFLLNTYLKVGSTSVDQKEPTPFIIEWIPDVLPASHVGELRLSFQFGHKRNGQVEQRSAGEQVAKAVNPAS